MFFEQARVLLLGQLDDREPLIVRQAEVEFGLVSGRAVSGRFALELHAALAGHDRDRRQHFQNGPAFAGIDLDFGGLERLDLVPA